MTDLGYGKFVGSKEEAKRRRQLVKQSGRCACYTKLRMGGDYFVQSCPRKLCAPQKRVKQP